MLIGKLCCRIVAICSERIWWRVVLFRPKRNSFRLRSVEQSVRKRTHAFGYHCFTMRWAIEPLPICDWILSWLNLTIALIFSCLVSCTNAVELSRPEHYCFASKGPRRNSLTHQFDFPGLSGDPLVPYSLAMMVDAESRKSIWSLSQFMFTQQTLLPSPVNIIAITSQHYCHPVTRSSSRQSTSLTTLPISWASPWAQTIRHALDPSMRQYLGYQMVGKQYVHHLMSQFKFSWYAHCLVCFMFG